MGLKLSFGPVGFDNPAGGIVLLITGAALLGLPIILKTFNQLHRLWVVFFSLLTFAAIVSIATLTAKAPASPPPPPDVDAAPTTAAPSPLSTSPTTTSPATTSTTRPALGNPEKLEGEDGSGGNGEMQRGNASQELTRLLRNGQTIQMEWVTDQPVRYETMLVRYSNDNTQRLERVELRIDNHKVGEFTPQDTGDFGHGWNEFKEAKIDSPLDLASGPHVLTTEIILPDADKQGVEIDYIELS